MLAPRSRRRYDPKGRHAKGVGGFRLECCGVVIEEAAAGWGEGEHDWFAEVAHAGALLYRARFGRAQCEQAGR